jgi:hypothetical protein
MNANEILTAKVGTITEVLESRHEERGWNRLPPVLYRICEPPMDDVIAAIQEEYPEGAPGDVQLGGFDISGVPLGMTKRSDIQEELTFYTQMIESEDDVLRGFVQKGFMESYPSIPLTHIIVAEVWTMPSAYTGETLDQIAERVGDRQMSDLSGAVEARFALGVTEKDAFYVQRCRGQDPQRYVMRNGEDPHSHLHGTYFEELKRLHLAVIKTWREIAAEEMAK